MSRVFEDGISEHHREWIARQALFFVATAPLHADGHVNRSPKGPIGSLRVLDPWTVAYLDVNGSGAETIAHLRENGRIVVMLCAFAGPPRILRLHGRGEVVRPGDDAFAPLLHHGAFADPSIPEARRAIVRVAVDRVAESCGYGVPLMAFEAPRDHHAKSQAKKVRVDGAHTVARRERERHAASLDGLPAL